MFKKNSTLFNFFYLCYINVVLGLLKKRKMYA